MIIGFLGRKRCGKDTAANVLINHMGFIRYAFGDPVKEVCRAMFCFNNEQLYGSKKEQVDPEWNITPRKAFQVIGTDFAQYSIYKEMPELEEKVPLRSFWVNRFNKWFDNQIKENNDIKVVISDVRFQHEVDAIKKLNGVIVQISSNREVYDTHLSENELETIKKENIDYKLENNNSLEEFNLKVINLYEKIISSYD